jgi:hypothetical protein
LQIYRRLCTPVKNISRNSVTDVRKSGVGRFPPASCHLSNSATSLHYLQILLSMFHYSQGVPSCGKRQQMEEIGRRRQGSVGT